MFKFFGAKYRLADTYPGPIHDLIVEPFAGSAAYAVRHRTTSRVVLIEKDARVVALWRRLLAMDVTDLLAIPDPIPGDTCDDLLVALAAGRTTRDTPSTFQVSPRMAQRFRPMVNRIASVLDECRHFEVIEGDYTDAPDVEATWFIDPPYQGQGGRWDRTRGGRYLHSNRDIDFTALARWCRERTGQVVVCEQAGADWLPWNGGVLARDGTHAAYGEVWWTNMHPAVGKHATVSPVPPLPERPPTMTGIPDLNLHVSRYSNKAIADSGLAPIRFTLGHPRWKLPYTIAGQIRVLAPTKAEFSLSGDAFTAAYRGRLDTLDPAEIAAEIAAIIVDTPGATGAVLLCYEDVRLGDLCHRSLFADWWEETTGHVVHELHDPTEPKHTHKKKATTVAPPTLF